MFYWKALLSILVALLLFEGMVAAFHLLNLPSDRSVLGGLCLLLAIVAGGFVVFRAVWRMK